MPNMTAGSFWQQFKVASKIGESRTEHESISWYVTREEDKEVVGEVATCLLTNTCKYYLVEGEAADMVLYWYRTKPLEESRREVHLLVRTMIGYGERALKLGCNLSTLHEAIGILRRCSQELKLSQVLRTMGEEERMAKMEESLRTENSGVQNSQHVGDSESEENSAHAPTGMRSQMRESRSLTSAERAIEEFITSGRPPTSGSRRIK